MERKPPEARARTPAIVYLEETATRWEAAGRRPSLLLRGLDLVALRCWISNTEGKRPAISDTLSAYSAACDAAQPEGWYDALLAERDECRHCHQRYRVENLAICTLCTRTYCHFCLNERPRAETGQAICFCSEGEMAG